MIAIILAGGYATRLWPLTIDKPKPLLPIAEKPIIEYTIEKLVKQKIIERTILSINKKFEPKFKEWQRMSHNPVEMVADRSRSEEEKLGAVKALENITSNIDDDCFILAGDNLFTSDLDGMIRTFKEKNAPIVALYDVKIRDLAREYSTINLNEDGRIIEFTEKPKKPKTTLIGTCMYILPKRTLPRLREHLESGLGRDEPGLFIEWLHKQEPVYGYILEGHWFDIGNLGLYKEAERFFSKLYSQR
ncbi:MAG: nucleotidyltransferase family protein [Candidatus Methylarchaceae archaeon HK01B]|nr:nucleotidyltransferase family protein [Candidatus Methylarchaceae archaeon HK01B]